MARIGLQLVFFTALISGISIFINQFGVQGIDSTIFTFTKNIIVSMLLVGILIWFGDFKRLVHLHATEWSQLIFIGLIGGSIPFVLFFRGLQLTGGAVGGFIHKTMFIFVAVLAVVCLKEQLSRRFSIAAITLLVGNFLLLNITSFHYNSGMIYVLIATLFWSIENVISKHILKTMEPTILAFGRLFFGSLFILAYMGFTSKIGLLLTLNSVQFSWILITVPFLLLYVVTWYHGLRQIKVTTATSVLLLSSPITTVLSALFTGTAFTVMQALGVLLIVVGILAVMLLSERKLQTSSTANP